MRVPGRSALVVQAGTATSTRERGEPNSFNVLAIERARVSVERRVWRAADGAFVPVAPEIFDRTAEGWERSTPPAPATEEPPPVG